MEVTNLTKKRIIEYLEQGKRFDKRDLLEHRDLKINLGISNMAEGSAQVFLGKTEVIAGVKLDTMMPYKDSAEAGVLMVTAELSPMASERFEHGPPRIQAIELARIIDRGIRESEIVDMSKLCIKKGEKVWSVMVDIYAINDDGNLIDAAAIAAVAAIMSAVMPKIDKDDKVQYGDFTKEKLPTTNAMPTTVTFYKIGSQWVIDPNAEEEESSELRISFAVSFPSDKKSKSKEIDKDNAFINAMQKGGGYAAVTIDEVKNLVDLAVEKAASLQEKIKKQLG